MGWGTHRITPTHRATVAREAGPVPHLTQLQVGEFSKLPGDGTACVFRVRGEAARRASPPCQGWEGPNSHFLFMWELEDQRRTGTCPESHSKSNKTLGEN